MLLYFTRNPSHCSAPGPTDDGQGSMLWYLSEVTWAAAQEGEPWELGVRTKPPCACWPLGHTPGEEAEPNPSLVPTFCYVTVLDVFVSWKANKDVLFGINPYPSKQNLRSLSILRPVLSCTDLGSAPFSSVKWNIHTPGSTVMNWTEAEFVFLASARGGLSEASVGTSAAEHHCPGMFI